MRINFTKMHGLGNDFMVIDAVRQDIDITPAMVQAWGDRLFGVGFDQLLIVEPPTQPEVAFKYRIFNADGDEVEQCGNGARCFAAYVTREGLSSSSSIKVETAGGIIELQLLDSGLVRVNMGVPRLQPDQVPFKAEAFAPIYTLPLEDSANTTVKLSAVSMGNPHAVLMVDNVDSGLVPTLGPVLECHPAFPARVNVGFMQVINRQTARLRVYERGVGETMACGSGACAAMVAARLQNKLDATATLQLNGGELELSWEGEGKPVFMTGPATFVFDGTIEWEEGQDG
ncbi:MAG: diaminopimelate epimerase [Natronospirillum sp.]